MQDTAKNVFPASATPWELSFNNSNKKIKCMHSGKEKGKSRRRKKWCRASDPTQEM